MWGGGEGAVVTYDWCISHDFTSNANLVYVGVGRASGDMLDKVVPRAEWAIVTNDLTND